MPSSCQDASLGVDLDGGSSGEQTTAENLINTLQGFIGIEQGVNPSALGGPLNFLAPGGQGDVRLDVDQRDIDVLQVAQKRGIDEEDGQRNQQHCAHDDGLDVPGSGAVPAQLDQLPNKSGDAVQGDGEENDFGAQKVGAASHSQQ